MIKTKEAKNILGGDSKHKEFVVGGNLHLAYIFTFINLAIWAKIDIFHLISVLDVDMQRLISNFHQVDFVVINIDKSRKHRNWHSLGNLVGTAFNLSSFNTICKYSTGTSSY